MEKLGSKDAIANIAVKNIGEARSFYEGVLGLTPEGTQGEEMVSYKSGGSKLFVYRSEYAGTNKATAVTWPVGDGIDAVVDDLKAKGVGFEHYDDMPGLELDGDVHVGDGMKIAWFKDPDGNILSVVSG